MSSHLSKTDTHLYGAPRPKNKPIPLSSTTSLQALSAELELARSAAPKTATSGRARVSKPRDSLFTAKNKGVASRAKKDVDDVGTPGGALVLKETAAESGKMSVAEMARSRKKMLEKARIYRQLKRGELAEEDVKGGGALVDFNEKWAKHGSDSEEESEDDELDEMEGGDEIVEYEDEFGRTRKGTRREAEREKRRMEAAERARRELEEGKKPPENVIYGNTIQTHAFKTTEYEALPEDGELKRRLEEQEEKAQKELESHYDGNWEVRTKGVGFYQFSKDNDVRAREMRELEEERKRTEREREKRKEAVEKRKREVEERIEYIMKKKRMKEGEKWLEGFMGAMGGDVGEKAGGGGEETDDEESDSGW